MTETTAATTVTMIEDSFGSKKENWHLGQFFRAMAGFPKTDHNCVLQLSNESALALI